MGSDLLHNSDLSTLKSKDQKDERENKVRQRYLKNGNKQVYSESNFEFTERKLLITSIDSLYIGIPSMLKVGWLIMFQSYIS